MPALPACSFTFKLLGPLVVLAVCELASMDVRLLPVTLWS